MLLHVVLGDKANTTFPAGRGVVKDVEDLELGSMDVVQFLEVVSQENILFIDVGVNEGDGGEVGRVFEYGSDDLDHGCDAGATSDHAELTGHARLVTEVALGTLDADSAADLELCDVLGDVTLLISLESDETFATQLEGRRDTLMRRSKWPRSLSLLTGV